MLSALGHHRFDITHRAVVLGSVVVDEEASGDALERRVRTVADDGADALLLTSGGPDDGSCLPATVEAVVRAFDGPVVVGTGAADVLEACLARGAAAGHDTAGLADPAYLATAAAADASVIVGGPPTLPLEASARAAQLVGYADAARAAGIAPDRIAVDVGRDAAGVQPAGAALLEEMRAVADAGATVFVHVAAPSTGPDDAARAAAAQALCVARGARMLVTTDVRTTRRVAVVAEALLRARHDMARTVELAGGAP